MIKELEALLVDYFQRGVFNLHQLLAVCKRYRVSGMFCQMPSRKDVEYTQFYFKFEQDPDDETARALAYELMTLKETIYGTH